MIKTILFLSAFALNISNPTWKVVYEEESQIVIAEEDIYQIVYEDKYILKSPTFEIVLPDLNNPKMFVDENIIIFYTENKELKVLSVSKSGKLIKQITIDESSFLDEYSICENNNFIIWATINEYKSETLLNLKKTKANLDKQDIAMFTVSKNLEITDVKIYGGKGNEKVSKVVLLYNDFYFLGQKDIISEGDFGNIGQKDGAYFLARIEKGSVEEKVSIKDQRVDDIAVIEENIVIASDIGLYSFTRDLNLEKYKELKNNDIFFMTNALKGVSINHESIKIYDLKTFYEDAILTNPFKNEVETKVFSLCFRSGKYKWDVAFFDDTSDKIIYEMVSPPSCKSLFGGGEYVSSTSDPQLSYSIHGTYELINSYILINKLIAKTISYVTIPKEVNVIEGRIYPANYKLLFTGKAFLNGKEIYNNYELKEEGNYHLEIYDNFNEKETINFTVSEDQVNIKEISERSWNKEVMLSTPYNIIYDVVSNKEIAIEYFIINDEKFTSFTYNKEKNIVVLNMPPINEAGLNLIKVQKMVYIDETPKEVNLSDDIMINVLRANIRLKTEELDESSVNFSIQDENKTSRYFELRYYSEDSENIIKYPLSDNELRLESLIKKQKYKVTLGIVYDNGNLKNSYIELAVFEIVASSDEINLGKIKITGYEDNLKGVKIEFEKKKSIERISVENNVIYQKKNNSSFFIAGFASFFASLACYVIINKIIKIKRKKLIK